MRFASYKTLEHADERFFNAALGVFLPTAPHSQGFGLRRRYAYRRDALSWLAHPASVQGATAETVDVRWIDSGYESGNSEEVSRHGKDDDILGVIARDIMNAGFPRPSVMRRLVTPAEHGALLQRDSRAGSEVTMTRSRPALVSWKRKPRVSPGLCLYSIPIVKDRGLPRRRHASAAHHDRFKILVAKQQRARRKANAAQSARKRNNLRVVDHLPIANQDNLGVVAHLPKSLANEHILRVVA